MNNQRKLNYSFRNRAQSKTGAKNDPISEPQSNPERDPNVSSAKPNQGPSYPSDCDNELPESQKLPEPDQPISAADLEHKKSVIRGKLSF